MNLVGAVVHCNSKKIKGPFRNKKTCLLENKVIKNTSNLQ